MTDGKEMLGILERIDAKLTLQLALYKLVNSERLGEEMAKILSKPVRKKIYNLCDGKASRAEIAKKVGTTQQNVSYHLSALAEAGLLDHKVKKGKKYFYKTME